MPSTDNDCSDSANGGRFESSEAMGPATAQSTITVTFVGFVTMS